MSPNEKSPVNTIIYGKKVWYPISILLLIARVKSLVSDCKTLPTARINIKYTIVYFRY